VTSTLRKREVVFAFVTTIDAACGERRDFIWKQMTVVRTLYFLRNLWLGFLRGVDDERFAFDQRPFYRLLVTVDFEGLAVLTRDIKEGAIDERREITVRELDMTRLHGVG